MSHFNPNMARYYAWSRLSSLIKQTYRRHFFTPYYSFHYVPPKSHTNFVLNPYH
jgi:hypothetical protein